MPANGDVGPPSSEGKAVLWAKSFIIRPRVCTAYTTHQLMVRRVRRRLSLSLSPTPPVQVLLGHRSVRETSGAWDSRWHCVFVEVDRGITLMLS